MKKIVFVISAISIVIISMVYLTESVKYANDIKYMQKDLDNHTSLIFFGDIMLGRHTSEEPFKYVKSLISSADLSSGNLEYAITERKVFEDKKIHLKAPCTVSKQLKDVGFDFLSTANNHIMDYGIEGMVDTIRCLDEMNIGYTGSGNTSSEAKNMKIVRVNNLSIGFLSYTVISPIGAFATENRGGVADFRINDSDIRASKSKVDYLVINAHWGKEYDLQSSDFQIKTGKQLIDYGADLVIGHHPHVVQPYDVYNGKYIFYSVGNFVFDQEHEITKDSFAVRVILDSKGKNVKTEKILLRIEDSKPYIKSVEVI